MSWTFGAATLEQDTNEFDVAIQTHERHGSKVPEDIKAAIPVAGVRDKDLQQWPMVNAEKVMDYEGVKRHVRIYLTNKHTFIDAARGGPPATGTGAQDLVPMDLTVLRAGLRAAGLSRADVDAVVNAVKGKSKGKKSKGKDNGQRRRRLL